MLALSPLTRASKEADGGPAWPAEALLQLCGRGRRVWAALHGPCNMLVWWSLRHGGVTGPGHDRHCAVGTDAVWSDFACVKRIRRHRGGALAPPLTSGFGRFGEVGSGASAPHLRRRIRLNRLYSLQSLPYSTDRCLSCLIPATPPCHGAHQNSIPAQPKEPAKVDQPTHYSCSRPFPASCLQPSAWEATKLAAAAPTPPGISVCLCSNLQAHRRLHDGSRCLIAERGLAHVLRGCLGRHTYEGRQSHAEARAKRPEVLRRDTHPVAPWTSTA